MTRVVAGSTGRSKTGPTLYLTRIVLPDSGAQHAEGFIDGSLEFAIKALEHIFWSILDPDIGWDAVVLQIEAIVVRFSSIIGYSYALRCPNARAVDESVAACADGPNSGT